MKFRNVNKIAILWYFSICISSVSMLGENENLADLLAMVKSNIDAAENYQFPKDNSRMLEVETSGIQDYGEYDFITVGTGPGGSVVANRLSEIDDWKVLVLEAGHDNSDFSTIYGYSSYLAKSDFNWGYNATPQKYGCLGMTNAVCSLPHGKVLGGTTIINGGLYSRGHPEDFDRWASVYNNKGWSWSEVLPYFKKSENAVFESSNEEYHGKSGYVTIDYAPEIPGMTSTIIKAFQELGLNNADYNDGHSNVVSRPQVYLKGNERESSAATFLNVHRKNLEVSLGSFVTKVVIHEKTKRAVGVEFVKNNTRYFAKARKEVLVSGGAYNSPQILMLSGIGPQKHLEELHIPVIEDLPVGQNLRTHPMFLGLVVLRTKLLFNETTEEALQKYIKHLKPLTSISEAIAFTNFGQGDHTRPTVEYQFLVPGNSLEILNTIGDVTIELTGLQPRTIGEITLKSKYPRDFPILNQKILENYHDVEVIYQGVQYLLQLSETEAFKDFGAEIVVYDTPYCKEPKLSKDWWICAIRHYSKPAAHALGTNSMGDDRKTSVVNSRLQVHDIEGLRVVDESIMPEIHSGHNAAFAYMISEKAADMIKEDYGRLYHA